VLGLKEIKKEGMEIILLLGDNFEGKDIPNLAYLLILPNLPKGTIMNNFVWKD
jgi:hypothetical protein